MQLWTERMNRLPLTDISPTYSYISAKRINESSIDELRAEIARLQTNYPGDPMANVAVNFCREALANKEPRNP